MFLIFSSSKPAVSTSYQQGIGMVEMLVALILLGVGLLGALSLQANGLSSNQRAVFVTEAQTVAQDMTNRILAFESTGANIVLFDKTDTAKVYDNTGCVAAGCSVSQGVEYDQFNWQQLIATAALPSGRGTVIWTDPVYTIRVMWDRDRNGATGTDCTSTDKKANLTCFEMQVRL